MLGSKSGTGQNRRTVKGQGRVDKTVGDVEGDQKYVSVSVRVSSLLEIWSDTDLSDASTSTMR